MHPYGSQLAACSATQTSEGGFYLNWAINKNGLPITLQYYLRISQRHRDSCVGRSYLNILNKISKFLSVPLRFINRANLEKDLLQSLSTGF